MTGPGVTPLLKASPLTHPVSSDFHGLGLEQLKSLLGLNIIFHLLLFLDFAFDMVSTHFLLHVN